MAEQPETIMEEREDLMVSARGGKPTKKISHFIKPILSLTDLTPEMPSASLPNRRIRLNCTFNGWRNPTSLWVSWVDRLHSSYQFIWKRVGIYEAILSSKYKIVKNQDLLLDLAERWCCDTNTFVFPWGEATITLEDVLVLGGYSVLGDSVSGSSVNNEIAEIEQKLLQVHNEIPRANQEKWMKHFKVLGDHGGIEHEAFLSLWLSRFVLPSFPYDTIVKPFFRIAIFLARGVQIALAPVVLASIYRDLSLLKSAMVVGSCSSASSSNQVMETDKGNGFDDLMMVTLWAPLQLVQVWAWERFPEFRPKLNSIVYGEPRLARWNAINLREIGNVRSLLQSSGHTFEWRPYCKKVDNLPLPCLYREAEELVILDDVLDDDIKSMVRVLRVCELVGMDTIEQYNPHRVAMQFGFDQDIPECVERALMGSDIPKRQLVQLSWLSYISPVKDDILYVPSRFYEPLVTVRYLKWLRKGVLSRQAALHGVVRKRRSCKRSRRFHKLRKLNNIIGKSIGTLDMDVRPRTLFTPIDNFDMPPEVLPKITAASNEANMPLAILQTSNVGLCADVPPGSPLKTITNKTDVAGKEENVPPGMKQLSSVVNVKPRLTTLIANDLGVPPGFSPKITAASKEANMSFGIIQKSDAGGFVDVPCEFTLKTTGNDTDVASKEENVPPRFTPKSNVVDVKPVLTTPIGNASNEANMHMGFTQKSLLTEFTVKTTGSKTDVVSKEGNMAPGFAPKSYVNVPPHIVPNTIGNNFYYPPGFSPKSSYEPAKLESEVKLKKENVGYTGNTPPMQKCGYTKSLLPSLAEIGSKEVNVLKKKAGESSGKNEELVVRVEHTNEGLTGDIARNVGPGREGNLDTKSQKNENLDLYARIQQLEKLVAELTETKSDTVFSAV